MSGPYTARWRSRRSDRARVVLAIILIVFTALVGMLGAAPASKAPGFSVPAADTRPVHDSPPRRPEKGV